MPILDQLNIVSGDIEASVAFSRRLGVDLTDQAIWRTAGSPHHVNARSGGTGLEFDGAAFAQPWNSGSRGRADLNGRVVIASAWTCARPSMRPIPT